MALPRFQGIDVKVEGSIRPWLVCAQRDQIGLLLQGLGNNFFTRIAQIFSYCLGYLEMCTFKSKSALASFWATFGRNSAAFYLNVWSHCLRSTIANLRSHFKSAKLQFIRFCVKKYFPWR